VRVSVRFGPVRVGGLVALLLWLLGKILRGSVMALTAAASHPRTTLTAATLLGASGVVRAHPAGLVVAVVAALVAGEVWALVSPSSFRRLVVLRALTAWRSASYRRQWRAACTVAELDVDGRLPRLVSVRCRDRVDELRVRAVLGQRIGQWDAAAPMLAHVFGADGYRVVRGDDRRLVLELARTRRGRSWGDV
jgi:hypothetical protein